MKAKKEKNPHSTTRPPPAETKPENSTRGMIRAASAITLQAGRVSASFIVKMEHMDNVVCCYQNMVLIKANIIY